MILCDEFMSRDMASAKRICVFWNQDRKGLAPGRNMSGQDILALPGAWNGGVMPASLVTPTAKLNKTQVVGVL